MTINTLSADGIQSISEHDDRQLYLRILGDEGYVRRGSPSEEYADKDYQTLYDELWTDTSGTNTGMVW